MIKLKRRFWAISVILMIFLLATAAVAEDITLVVGQTHALLAAPNQSVHVKGSRFVHLSDQHTKILVTGRAPGESQISIGEKEYNIFVTGARNKGLLGAFRELLKTKLDLHAEMAAGRVSVTGQLHRLQDWIDLAQIAANYNTEYVFRARLDPDVESQARDYFRDRLIERNLPRPNFVWSPAAHAIISQDDKNLKSLWDEALAPYGVERDYEKSEMSIKPLVRVRITIAEINKKARRELGVDWPESITSQLLPQFETPNLSVTLHALESSGLGQILASPNLLARSGAEADFLAGGQIPIRAATKFYQQVSWKDYGIHLKIKPVADFSGRMSITLTTEVSLIDMSQAIDHIPALKTDRVSTQFDLSEPRTIVLSGLIRNDWGKDSTNLPYLSKIPIIGRLFSSEDFQKQHSELLIFVTPEIVNVRDESAKIHLPKLPGISQ